MKTLLIIAASAMSASLLVPTLAEARTFEDFEQVSQVVRYDDLNLATQKGQATLDRRIAYAARTVCGAHERSVNVVDALAANACIQQAKEQARREAQIAIQRTVNQARPA